MLLALALLWSCDSPSPPPTKIAPAVVEAPAVSAARAHGCPVLRTDESPAAWGKPGQRKLALLVGVGDYALPEVPDLGAAGDAERMYSLLVDSYGFPPENVCVLLDGDATVSNLERAWASALTERAAPGDVAVFYFAGHGSQARDWDRDGVDEPDGWDETLMLHDSRVGGTPDLLDDVFNGWLARLHAVTPNLVVVLDACNSGSASRGLSEGVQMRQFVPYDVPPPQGYDPRVGGDYSPAELPGLVFAAAALDGTPALEREGEGLFTRAVLTSLRALGADASWAQLAATLPRALAAEGSPQVATFEGPLDRPVFGGAARPRPPSWSIVAVDGASVRLEGAPMVGWSAGAILGVYPGNMTSADIAAGASPSGRVALTALDAFTATGRILEGEARAADLAVLLSPGSAPPPLVVRLVERGRRAVPAERAAALQAALPASVVVGKDGAFSVGTGEDGALEVIGPEGVRRLSAEDPAALAEALGRFAQQQLLASLASDPGDALIDGQTVEVRVERAPDSAQKSCPKEPYVLAAPGRPQALPLCTTVEVRVTLAEESPTPLYVGGVWLVNDGSLVALPPDNARVLLKPGESAVLPFRPTAAPPLDALDTLLIYGTEAPVDWARLGDAQSRSVDGLPAWTVTALPLRVVADPALWTDAERSDPAVCRERRQTCRP